MRVKEIVFAGVNVVRLEETDFNPRPSDNEITIRTLVTVISAGTELACLEGRGWAPFPFRPGYGAIGEVIATGKNIQGIQVGDRIFTYSRHASYAKSRTVALKVPEGCPLEYLVFARMASVAITALRVSNAELGDRVAVIGLGVVGNLAAQLFQLAGCDVIAFDRIPKRLDVAKACGIKTTVNVSEVDPVEAVKEWTEGKGCEVVVEATGTPQAAMLSGQMARRNGEVILLGSFFGRELITNVTDLLERIHLWGHGCITYKGAHEWRYPIPEDPQGFSKHSIERNAKLNLRLIAEGRLKIAPLLTHRMPPEQCADAYAGLRDRPDEFIGVVFDWTQG